MLKSDKELKSQYRSYKKNGKKIDVHRHVAMEKIGRDLLPNEVVHHIDGNKLNNSPDNLMVMTRSEHGKLHMQNGDYDKSRSEESRKKLSIAAQEYYKTHTHPSSKKVARCDRLGNVLEEFKSIECTNKYGYYSTHVSACCHGKRKTHKGFIWKFV